MHNGGVWSNCTEKEMGVINRLQRHRENVLYAWNTGHMKPRPARRTIARINRNIEEVWQRGNRRFAAAAAAGH